MRIISSFHDYYDSVQVYGQDRSLVYMREPKEQKETLYPFRHEPLRTSKYSYGPLDVDVYCVGFCGKVYGLLRLESQYHPRKSKYCYSTADVDEFVRGNFSKEQIEIYDGSKKASLRYKHCTEWRFYHRRVNFEKYFIECAAQKDRHLNIFLDNHTPVFLFDDSLLTLTINPCLKDVDFFRVFDPYWAFQEVAMFLGGLARPLNPIPEIKDEDMVEIKGFDKKTSFRKDKK